MNYTEAIVELHNIVDKNFCDEVIKLSKKQCKNYFKIGSKGLVNKDERNVLGHHLDPKDHKIMFNKIVEEITRLYKFYKIKFPYLRTNKINQIDLLKYNEGGKYGYHVDTYTDFTRTLSVIINLNNEYEGGDLIFVDQKNFEIKKIKLGIGSAVFFPSNFMYPHGIQPITKGTRYSIVAWLQ